MRHLNKSSIYDSKDYRSSNFSGNWTKHFINDFIDSIFKYGKAETFNKFSSFKNEHLPKNLYKFYSPSLYSLISIQNQTIYLSTPRSFNDPFDSYVCFDQETFRKLYLLKTLKEQNLVTDNESLDTLSKTEYWEIFHTKSCDNNSHRSYFHRKSLYSVMDSITKKKSKNFTSLTHMILSDAYVKSLKKINYLRNVAYRISCFSSFDNEDELLMNTTMWSHYADDHRGFCIKYNLDFDIIGNKDEIKCGLFPITYSSKVPQISPRELLKLKFKNQKLDISNSIQKSILKTLLTKSPFWNYEKEWRLIIDSPVLNENIPFFSIKSIYLGCRIEDNLKRHLISFALKNGISVFQTKQDESRFRLNALIQSESSLELDDYFKKRKFENSQNNY